MEQVWETVQNNQQKQSTKTQTNAQTQMHTNIFKVLHYTLPDFTALRVEVDKRTREEGSCEPGRAEGECEYECEYGSLSSSEVEVGTRETADSLNVFEVFGENNFHQLKNITEIEKSTDWAIQEFYKFFTVVRDNFRRLFEVARQNSSEKLVDMTEKAYKLMNDALNFFKYMLEADALMSKSVCVCTKCLDKQYSALVENSKSVFQDAPKTSLDVLPNFFETALDDLIDTACDQMDTSIRAQYIVYRWWFFKKNECCNQEVCQDIWNLDETHNYADHTCSYEAETDYEDSDAEL